jgi:pseudoazurin
MKFLIICLSFLISSPVIASEITVEMLNKDANGNRMVYSQEVLEVAAGSTVKWVPTDKGHNVEIIASPNDMKFKSKNGKEASVTFETPGIYYYWCTPHKGMGMIGLVVVGGDTSNKAQISKAKAIGKSKKKLKALLAQLN